MSVNVPRLKVTGTFVFEELAVAYQDSEDGADQILVVDKPDSSDIPPF